METLMPEEDSLREMEMLMQKDYQMRTLADAAEHDDVNKVVELVNDEGPDILRTPMPFAHMGTILHICTECSSLQTLHKVATYYPTSLDVFICDRDGDTALHNIPNVEKSYDDCKRAACCLLGLAGTRANKLLAVQNDHGRMTALCKALALKNLIASRALLDAAKEQALRCSDAASSKEATNKLGEHWLALTADGPWIYDAYIGSVPAPMAQQYTRLHADVHAFCTALHLAVLGKYKEIATQILTYPGAKELQLTSRLDHHGNTPLHVAAKLGNQKICSMLLKYGVAINKDGSNGVKSQNKDGETPLHMAATYGHAEVCEELLQYGASLSSKDKLGRYALTNAFVRGHNEAVKKLLDACTCKLSTNKAKHSLATSAEAEPSLGIDGESQSSPDINQHFALGLTPLHVAVAISSRDHICNLIEAGALVHSKSDDGQTPLHIAAEQYDIDALNQLLKGSTKFMQRGKPMTWINTRDARGKTALHNVVRLLRRSGSTTQGGELESYTDEGSDDCMSSEESNGNLSDVVEETCENEMMVEQSWVTKITGDGICEMVRALLKKGGPSFKAWDY